MRIKTLTLRVADSEFKALELDEVNCIYKRSKHDLLVKLMEVNVNGLVEPEKLIPYDVVILENENGSRMLTYKYQGFKIKTTPMVGVYGGLGVYLRFDLSKKID